MKRSILLSMLSLAFLMVGTLYAQDKAKDKNVLIFYKTEGFWHESIPAGYQAIGDLGDDHGFDTDDTDDAKDFTKENLKKYDLVIFLNTTGDVLDAEQQEAFKDYIEKGGSFFGIHSAADTEYDWEWYGKLVGAYFENHPKVQEADIEVLMPEHPAVSHLPERWTRKDEWYNYKNINPDNKVLLNLDESTYEGGTNGEDHPIAWYRELEGGGISIYTGLGHTIQSYVEPAFLEHLLQSILFAINEKKVVND
ncbi:MAG TPA: ThuA domain-containing protein [Gillisia sp.]|nr:ThuA domain-containing protein [Gillisia sp.]